MGYGKNGGCFEDDDEDADHEDAIVAYQSLGQPFPDGSNGDPQNIVYLQQHQDP